MTNKRIQTKIIYILIIVALLLPLFLMGRPASGQRDEEGKTRQSGGYLVNLRRDEDITDAQLGQIDPGSSTMKLATFGMRGVALALLWHKSLDYEKKFDWNNVVVTSNQITMLEPRFIPVWDHLGWRLAYNASANQDDYRERYRWVIRGFEFLEEGTHYNRKAPFLYHKAGWTISQKIGIADEKEQYRRLFREDDDFHDAHETRSIEERDNWLFGIPWYQKAEELFLAEEERFFAKKADGLLNDDQVKEHYADKKRAMGNMSRPIFMADSRRNRIHYADWYEQDGNFGEKAQYNWAAAAREWDEFGDIRIITTIDDRKNPGQKRTIYLKEAAESQKAMDALNEELLTLLVPRTKKDLYVERWNSLTQEQQSTFVDNLKKPGHEYLVVIREYLDESRPNWEAELTELRNALFDDAPDELDAYLLPEPIRKGNRGVEQSDERDEINMAQKASRAIDEVRNQAVGTLILSSQAIVGEIASYERRQNEEYQDYLAKLKENPDLANDPETKVVEPPTNNAPRAREIQQLLDNTEGPRFQLADMFEGLVNYVHYGQETEVEQTQEAINANEARFIARRAFNKEGNIFKANDYYLEAMRIWQQLSENPRYDYLNNDLFRRDFIDFVDRYRHVTTKLDDSERGDLYPEDFPFAPTVRLELSLMGTVGVLHESLLHLRQSYEKGNYDEVADRSLLLLQAWQGLMLGCEYLPHVPVPEYRDEVVETFALYVSSLKKTGREFGSDVPLIEFLNKVMYYDPLTREALQKTLQIDWTLPDGEPTSPEVVAAKEAILKQLRDAAYDWNLVVMQFPILTLPTSAYVDPSVNPHGTSHLRDCRETHIGMINDSYVGLSRELNRPITTDYPLHEMLSDNIPVLPAPDAPIPQENAQENAVEPETKSEPQPESGTQEPSPVADPLVTEAAETTEEANETEAPAETPTEVDDALPAEN